MNQEVDLQRICHQFRFTGDLLEVAPYGQGHIHATFVVRNLQRNGGIRRYLLQRINRQVFPEPEKVMANIVRVTEHLRQKIVAKGGDPLRGTINLIPTQNGEFFYRTEDGEYWRAEAFIEGAKTHPTSDELHQYYNAARAFGRFQHDLADFPVHELHVTIPDFHHTGKRFERFSESVQKDVFHRASAAKDEIEFAFQHSGEVNVLTGLATAGELPERVTHNDAKLDNILMDEQTGEVICVIDLDTVMPGLAVYDFGDLVRSGANTASEDEPDLARVKLDLGRYENILRGFLDGTRDSLTSPEIDQLPFAARLITFEQGLRFLTDYLDGDSYYRLQYADHNLVRARTQFQLVAEMEARFDEMMGILERDR